MCCVCCLVSLERNSSCILTLEASLASFTLYNLKSIHSLRLDKWQDNSADLWRVLDKEIFSPVFFFSFLVQINANQLLQLVDLLRRSHAFAREFNSNEEQRNLLWKAGVCVCVCVCVCVHVCTVCVYVCVPA